MLRKYQHFDRTRLFRDPDWRCCRRWIGVEVPWKPQFNEKFRIKLTREGPLVLVLSQLDNRYFKGLHGQYLFRLHFRLHERDRPGAEDYIVRSHGNYLMDRSVSIELPCMLPGEYSVFISVVGERDTDAPSIEDVVKRECKRRVENEKLAQVGYAYDLAHSKATAHLEAVAALRKKSDQQKASNFRKAERYKQWHKRHINREVGKLQGRKNNTKIKAKDAAREEKKKREEELKPKDVSVQTEEVKGERKEVEEKEKPEEEEEGGEKEEKSADGKEEEGKNSDGKEDKKGDAQEEAQGKEPEEEKSKEPKPDGDKSDKGEEPGEGEQPGEKPEGETKAEEGSEVAAKDDKESPDTTPEATPDVTPSETPAEEKSESTAAAGDDNSNEKREQGQEEKSETVTNDGPSGENASVDSSDTSGSTQNTPNSEESALAKDDKDKEKVTVPPVDASNVSGGPPSEESGASTSSKAQKQASNPPTPAEASKPSEERPKKPPHMYVTSDGESSASPIDDWEELYSSDNMTRKTRVTLQPQPTTGLQSKYREDTEDENEPDPWNAICVVGIRVYSKDEDLELRVVMEGGQLGEGGMGEKGEQDLDNAQANAAGQRLAKEEATKEETTEHVVEPTKEDQGYEGDSEVEKEKTKRRKDKTT